jgi:hypothetical protein
MSERPWKLAQIERWMQAIITHPGGVADGIQSPQARAAAGASQSELGRIVNRSSRRTAIERLEVYANAYYARLLECLRDEFPALVHALGEEAFDGLAFAYLVECPPTSYTLAELGRRFPDYLERTRPVESDDRPVAGWADFLVDLARLERTYGEVFDGPGIETLPPLRPEQIDAIPAGRRLQARLQAAPCLRLLSLRFPAHEYATAVRRDGEPRVPERSTTWLAVSRIDYVVRRWPLSAPQFALLESLVAGDTLQAAIERAAVSSAGIDDLAGKLGAWFREWSANGFFVAIDA